jgi:hypothetical protein
MTEEASPHEEASAHTRPEQASVISHLFLLKRSKMSYQIAGKMVYSNFIIFTNNLFCTCFVFGYSTEFLKLYFIVLTVSLYVPLIVRLATAVLWANRPVTLRLLKETSNILRVCLKHSSYETNPKR